MASRSVVGYTGRTSLPAGMQGSRGARDQHVVSNVQRPELQPGNRGYYETIPPSTDFARQDLAPLLLEMRQCFFPDVAVDETLPFLVDGSRCPDAQDKVTITITWVTEGRVHMNPHRNATLTSGAVRQEETILYFNGFGTEVRSRTTPWLYTEIMPIEGKKFEDDSAKAWERAHKDILQIYTIAARNAMYTGVASILDFTDSLTKQRSLFEKTHRICDRYPNDFVSGLLGAANEAAIAGNFKAGQLGKLLLVPRRVFIEKFSNASKEITPQNEKWAKDNFSLYTFYNLPPGLIASTATVPTGFVKLADYTVAPFDRFPDQEIPDPFFADRVEPSCIVFNIGSRSMDVPTPEGSRTITSVDLAVSAGMVFRREDLVFSSTCQLVHNAQNGFSGNYRNETLSSHLRKFAPTVGGMWPLQTDDGILALSKWLVTIAQKFSDLGEAETAIQRMTLVPATLTDVAKAAPAYNLANASLVTQLKLKYGQTPSDEAGKIILLLAALPCTNVVMQFLDTYVPFDWCNFTFYMVGMALCADGYLVHPKLVKMFTRDNFVQKKEVTDKIDPVWYTIGGGYVCVVADMNPNMRFPTVHVEDEELSLRTIGTCWDVSRTGRARGQSATTPDSFAIFSGVDSRLPGFCENGPNSVAHIPTKDCINDLYNGNADATACQIDLLDSGGWLRKSDSSQDPSRDCPFYGYSPWPARVTKSDKTVVALKGLGQMKLD